MHPFSKRDICTRFITPALERAGWDLHTQIREEVGLTNGRIIVRAASWLTDHVPYHKPSLSTIKKRPQFLAGAFPSQ